jgi:hypothetical protein
VFLWFFVYVCECFNEHPLVLSDPWIGLISTSSERL